MMRDPLELTVICIAGALAIIAIEAIPRPKWALTRASALMLASSLAALLLLYTGISNTAIFDRVLQINSAQLVLMGGVLGCLILQFTKRHLAGEQHYGQTAAMLILLCATTLLAMASSSFVLSSLSGCAALYVAFYLARQTIKLNESASTLEQPPN